MMYVKLFSSILTSSVWAEDNATRIVWITMLALADREGDVRASPSGLARMANVSPADCQRAIAKLLAPDPESGTPTDDGRRIAQCEGGWHILNYVKYRDLQDAEARKAQWREGAKRYRARQQSSTHRQHASTSRQHASTHTDTDTDTEAKAKAKTTTALVAQKRATDTPAIHPDFDTLWQRYPKRAGSNPRQTAYKAFLARIGDGVRVEALADALGRYTAFCEATGKVGTEYVMQGQRFFGPNGGWRELWDIPATPPTGSPDKVSAGRSALAEWLADREAANG